MYFLKTLLSPVCSHMSHHTHFHHWSSAGTGPSNLQLHLKAQWSSDGLFSFFLLDPGSSQGSFGTLSRPASVAPIVCSHLVSRFVGAQCTAPHRFLYVLSYMCQDGSGWSFLGPCAAGVWHPVSLVPGWAPLPCGAGTFPEVRVVTLE